MNDLEKLKKQLKSEDKIPLLLVCGMQNWFAWRTDQPMTAAQFYLFICDFFTLINDWLKKKYQIVDFLNEEINIQRKSDLSEINIKLFDRYLKASGRHSAISGMIVLGLIPYLRTLNEDEIIPELNLCIKEINGYLKEVCSFSGKFIKRDLKNEILAKEFKIKEKEIA